MRLCENCESALADALEAVTAERDAAVVAIAAAPHAIGCPRRGERLSLIPSARDCNCWKSRALASLSAPEATSDTETAG